MASIYAHKIQIAIAITLYLGLRQTSALCAQHCNSREDVNIQRQRTQPSSHHQCTLNHLTPTSRKRVSKEVSTYMAFGPGPAFNSLLFPTFRNYTSSWTLSFFFSTMGFATPVRCAAAAGFCSPAQSLLPFYLREASCSHYYHGDPDLGSTFPTPTPCDIYKPFSLPSFPS